MRATGEDDVDERLLADMQRGEQSALAALYDRYSATLFAVGLRVLRNESDAEDLVHDAFVTAWRRATQYAPERGSVAVWLITIARNMGIDRLRSRARQGRIERDVVAHEHRDFPKGPESLAELAELRARVQALLVGMPEGARVTLELAFFEGLSYPEIATKLGIPLATVKSRVARGIEALRGAMRAADTGQTP